MKNKKGHYWLEAIFVLVFVVIFSAVIITSNQNKSYERTCINHQGIYKVGDYLFENICLMKEGDYFIKYRMIKDEENKIIFVKE